MRTYSKIALVPALAVAMAFAATAASAQTTSTTGTTMTATSASSVGTYYDASSGITYQYDPSVGFYFNPATGQYNTAITATPTYTSGSGATTPGLPDTGMGGNAALAWALVGSAAVAAAAGAGALKRKSA